MGWIVELPGLSTISCRRCRGLRAETGAVVGGSRKFSGTSLACSLYR